MLVMVTNLILTNPSVDMLTDTLANAYYQNMNHTLTDVLARHHQCACLVFAYVGSELADMLVMSWPTHSFGFVSSDLSVMRKWHVSYMSPVLTGIFPDTLFGSNSLLYHTQDV